MRKGTCRVKRLRVASGKRKQRRRPAGRPRLRFGRTYRMRARCVDLAGNSQPLTARSVAGSVVGPEPFGRLARLKRFDLEWQAVGQRQQAQSALDAFVQQV